MRKQNIYFFSMLSLVIALMTIGCSDDDDNPVIAEPAPEISSVEASMDTLNAVEVVTMTCNTAGTEGDSLTYAWSCDSGTFPNGTSGNTAEWEAPDISGTYTINVEVTNNAGSTSGSHDIFVRTGSTGIMPLRVGNYWNFDFHVEGIIVGEWRWDVSVANGSGTETWYQINVTVTSQGDEINDTLFLTNRGDGCYRKETLGSSAELWWKYPAVEDDTWLSLDGEMRIVVSTDDTSTVPAGTFTGCYHYFVVGEEELTFEIIKPVEGPVEIGGMDDDGTIFELKLKEINLE